MFINVYKNRFLQRKIANMIILKNDKFKSFSLGKNILRSETAAMAGLVLLNFLLN